MPKRSFNHFVVSRWLIEYYISKIQKSNTEKNSVGYGGIDPDPPEPKGMRCKAVRPRLGLSNVTASNLFAGFLTDCLKNIQYYEFIFGESL